jgi:hypothetical protein
MGIYPPRPPKSSRPRRLMGPRHTRKPLRSRPGPHSSNLLHQQCQNRLQVIVGQFLQFFIGAILHRMRHEHVSRVGAQAFRLHGSGIDELGSGDTDRRNSAGFKIRKVMRTARRAGASVSQSFNDDVHLAHDLLP